MRNDDILYDYWWASLGGNYNIPLCRIAFEAGGTRRLYNMDRKQLVKLRGVSEKLAGLIAEHREGFDKASEYSGCLEKGISFIPFYSARFPERLRKISGHPFAIFVKGELPSDDRPCVAIIGARDCSEYGRRTADELGSALAGYDICVVSGMALGIDGTAQTACLNAGGYSLGILGCGADVCYPEANRELYDRLCLQGGIISEYGPGTRPKACLFPARNRIISAFSDVVVVVEARLRSGTCITVDMALEQGKDVAVVPGRITDPLSAGCIRLLKQGAVPVASAEDIVSLIVSSYNEYPGLLNKAAGTDRQEDDNKDIKDSPASAPAEETSLSPEERRLFGVLDYYAKSADKLCDESGLGIPEFMNAVMQLKIKGFVKELGKDCFVRVL